MKKSTSNNEFLGRIAGIAGNVFDTVLQILLIVAIVLIISRGAKTAYDYGYRIFTEKPMATTVGKEVEVNIPLDFNALELGKIFENNGLTRDSKLLALQYYASEYRDDIKGGTYTLSTTMTAEEMFGAIANVNIEKEKLLKEAEEEKKAEEDAAAAKEQEAGEDDEPGTEESADEGIQQIDMGEDSDSLMEEDVR
ncbi:MAG: hypothetical protein K5669_06765 [Lachnospiraceae bacterium]|nr:hypothetical protein [Lachnospiraceae bacterium]